jgi:AraC family transcriptional regulator
MAMGMAESDRTPQALRADYVARVNRVMDYVERNLHQPLSLATLADVAELSRYHFHRIFGAMVGETLHGFVQRLRVERAATMLVVNPKDSITTIAIDCGFSSSATFARAFKEAFGMSATEWRGRGDRNGCEAKSKIRNMLGNAGEASPTWSCYIDPTTSNPTWRQAMSKERDDLKTTIEVKELPEHSVVYLRHVGPYGQVALVPRLVEKLRGWAVPRGLVTSTTRLFLVPHDDPNVTAPDKLRLSVCLTVPVGTAGEGEVGTMQIPGGTYAVARFEIPPARIADAWNVVLGRWLPQSGYQPDDRLCYEEALSDPREHPEGKIVLDICVPVRPL